MQKKLLINGRLVAGQGDVEDILNPATGRDLSMYALEDYTAVRHVMVKL